MKIVFIITFILLALLTLILFFIPKKEASFEKVSLEEMYLMNESIIIIDVRTEEEYALGHLDNSINIPVDYLTEDRLENINKDEYIFLYCRSGVRSVTAANILIELGYVNVYDLGGITEF